VKKNNFKPLVSVIMNCHNGEKYLRKSLQSLILQNYKNWELIFWNNCSSDNSKKIFNSLKDSRFKYYENDKLKNLYDARNLATNKAKGKYICFLDTDDWWIKTKLEKQIKLFLSDKKINFVYSNFFQFYQNTKKSKVFYKNVLPQGIITQKLLDNYCIGVLTVMIKKKVFKDDIFDKFYNIIGDFEFFFRLSKKYKFRCVQEPLAYYRIHSNNYSKIKFNDHIKEYNYWLSRNRKIRENKKYSFNKIRIIKFKLKIKKFLKIF
jgi:glycosyltransferase involved in cell wall biosynthesis